MDAVNQPAESRWRRWRAHVDWVASLPANSGAAFMLWIAISGAPFLFGSRAPSTVAFWCLWLAIATALASPRRLGKPQVLLLGGVFIIGAGYGFVLHEQLASHPWLATPHPIWAEASQALHVELAPSASITRDEAYFALGPVLANFLALILGIIVGADRRHARAALIAAGVSGGLYAAYGIVADIFTPTAVLWRDKEAYVGEVTGTFINKNTAATYFGSVSVIWLMLLVESIRDQLPRGPLRLLAVWNRSIIKTRPDTMAPFLLFFICLAALLMTQSRGGVILSLCALLFSFWLFFRRDLMGRTNRGLVIAAAIMASIVILQVFSGVLGHRLDMQGLTDAGRFATYKSTLSMIADRPWFGTGLGTFAWSFPAYRSDDVSMWGIWDIGHSTPLQMASEVGIPLTLLVGIGWATALVVLFRGVLVRKRDMVLPLTALAISILALTHSTIDFSLQIAGYSIVVFGLLGVGLAQSFSSRGPSTTSRRAELMPDINPASPGSRRGRHRSGNA